MQTGKIIILYIQPTAKQVLRVPYLHYNFGDHLFSSVKRVTLSQRKRKRNTFNRLKRNFKRHFTLYPDYFEAYFQLAATYFYDNHDSLSIVYYQKSTSNST